MRKALIILVLLSTWAAMAQDGISEKLVVPLSSPGESGKLKVNQINGHIFVEGYDGQDIIIEATFRSNNQEKEREKDKSAPPGMKRIASNPAKITAKENDNIVSVNTESWKKRTDLKIKVPSDFDLHLHTIHGEIDVRSVQGEMEISGVNGGVSLDEISGSVVCNTVNGPVIVRFVNIDADTPMSFVTLNGNVDVTLPGSAGVTAKMKSDQGEIYTDFDMEMKSGNNQVKRGRDCDDCNYEISINSWVFGEINNGGPEFTFKNMNGDILIRKRG